MSYPYGGGGGYPQPGYPGQGGYPQQPGYPGAGPGYPAPGTGMPQPEGGGAYPGGTPYAPQPGALGFGGQDQGPAGGVTMPTPESAGAQPYGMPPGGAYQPPPPAASYNPPGAGYGAQPGYPGGAPPVQPGYPGAQPGYPGAAPQAGYPGASQGGYPGGAQPQAGGYPGAAPQAGGYPGAAPQAGGYPGAAPQAGGYPGGAPPQQPGYHTGAPPQQAGYGGGAPPGGIPPIQQQMANMSISSSQPMGYNEQGTVRPVSPFHADKDAEILRKAMKGLGTDEKAIIDILSQRSNAQRLEIAKLFKTMYGRDVISDLKSELSGHFEDVIVAVMTATVDFDATILRNAVQGLGTDENALIEVMCTRTNAQIQEIKVAYKRLFKRDLEPDLASDTSGHFKKLMVSMSAGGRMENQPVDPARAKADATAIYQAGEKRWGTDESKFNQILASQSYPQLKAVFDEYAKVSKRTMEQAVKSEMSGNLEQGMLTIVKCVNNRPAYFAEQLYRSMKGAGTDDRTLVRVVVTRSEVDMVQIKNEFKRMYGKTLEQFIKDDTSGDYKRMLMALVGGR